MLTFTVTLELEVNERDFPDRYDQQRQEFHIESQVSRAIAIADPPFDPHARIVDVTAHLSRS